MANHQHEPESPSSEEFEEFVAAALRVDPKGLSGKHRHNENAPEGQAAQEDCG